MKSYLQTFREQKSAREKQLIQEVQEQLADYQIEVKHRDGVYRYLVCSNPAKGYERCFQVHTAPGMVTIKGRWCHAYTLVWEYDMLSILNTYEPLFKFCAGLLQTDTKIITVAPRVLYLGLDTYLDNWAEECCIDPGFIERCKRQLRTDFDYFDQNLIEKLKGWHLWYTDTTILVPFANLPYNIAPEWEAWTDEWIRVCELLRWTACKVRGMEKLGK